MGSISSHVLDTERGCPAPKVPVTLSVKEGNTWRILAQQSTNDDGRISSFVALKEALAPGIYELNFFLDKYFALQNRRSFYPEAVIRFTIENPHEHFHVPLLLSAFGFSSYRGS